jgi:hypothetical protein
MRTLPRALGVVLLLATHTALAAEPPAAPAPTPPAPAAPPAAAAPAPPAPPSAEALADATRQSELARQAQKAKRYGQAAHLFEAAAALGRQPGAFHSAGLAWELADRPERAADAYARALAAGEGLSATETQQAKDRLDALERSLGTLDVKAPAGWTVQLDGGAEAPVPARLHGVAGFHSLATAAPERAIARRDVRLELGKATALTLKDEPSSSAKAPTEPSRPEPAPSTPTAAPAQPRVVTVEAPPSGQVRRAVGFTALGLGVAALGASVVLGLETLDARNAYNASPSRPLYDHEQTLQTWTNAALIGGAVLAVGGIVLVVWPSGGGEGRVGLAPSPGGGSVVGTF